LNISYYTDSETYTEKQINKKLIACTQPYSKKVHEIINLVSKY